ncbi:MAG: radical SAM protein, partial [Proteobacteria bacterium]|nr:radical SAM protein [Pseudomonadota bacterium]
MTLKVNEIFYSIQGESSYAGWPCIFIRLTGCNLRCSYCDTAYAYEEGEEKTVFAILEEIQKFQCVLVEITGGEPLLQAETPVLVNGLLKQGYRVILETNGSLDIRRVSNQCVRIVDFKCPGSGMADANNLKNLDYLSDQDEVKFVIGSREDFNYARALIERMGGSHKKKGGRIENSIHFAPVFGKLE